MYVIRIIALPSFTPLYTRSLFPHNYTVRCSKQLITFLILQVRELRMAEVN